jgi:hypothetical protein
MKHISTVCGENAELVNVKASGTRCFHNSSYVRRMVEIMYLWYRGACSGENFEIQPPAAARSGTQLADLADSRRTINNTEQTQQLSRDGTASAGHQETILVLFYSTIQPTRIQLHPSGPHDFDNNPFWYLGAASPEGHANFQSRMWYLFVDACLFAFLQLSIGYQGWDKQTTLETEKWRRKVFTTPDLGSWGRSDSSLHYLYRLDDRGSIPARSKSISPLPLCPDQLWRPPSLLFNR